MRLNWTLFYWQNLTKMATVVGPTVFAPSSWKSKSPIRRDASFNRWWRQHPRLKSAWVSIFNLVPNISDIEGIYEWEQGGWFYDGGPQTFPNHFVNMLTFFSWNSQKSRLLSNMQPSIWNLNSSMRLSISVLWSAFINSGRWLKPPSFPLVPL